MLPFEHALREIGVIEKPKPKPKPEPVQREPVDQWWKRGEECPY